jgi:anti-sigma regulatory factor (Ser/Thr protein kinase)
VDALTLPGRLDSLKLIREFVAQAAQTAGLEKKAAYRLNLAVDEIATNVIIHGYEEAELDGEVIVRADITDQALLIELEDFGAGYDPVDVADPAGLDQPLDQRTEGGLGVYLAVRSVDKFTYERHENSNLHTFVIELNNRS